jgi:hypothetical protein
MKPVFNPFTAQLELKRDADSSGTSGVYHVDEWNGDLIAAIGGVPAGSTLQLGAGPYVGITGGVSTANQITKSITIRGIGAPSYAADSLSLVGGTVIKGGLYWRNAQDVTIRDLGLDCGPTWFAGTGGATAVTDCLGIWDSKNITVENVVTLNSSYQALTHCVVMVNDDRVSIRNLQTRYGIWGLVLKTKNTVVDGLLAESHSSGHYHVKSNEDGVVENVKATNVTCRDLVGTSTQSAGIYILAATADTNNVQVSNFTCQGMENGVILGSGANLPWKTVNTVLTNGIINAKGYGIYASVSAKNEVVMIGDIVYNGDGRAIQMVGNEMTLNNVIASTPTADPNNVIVNGTFCISDLISCINFDFGQRTGISLNPTNNNLSLMRLGRLIGDVRVAGQSLGLTLNTSQGWLLRPGTGTTAFRMEGSRITVEAQVSVPSGSRTGKEVVATFQPIYAPRVDVMMLAWGMTTVNEPPVPVVVRVTTTGEIRAEYVANSAQVPEGLTTLSLHGLSWLLNDL